VVGAQVEIGGGDGTHAPFRLRRERGALIVADCGRDYLIAVLVYRARDCGSDL
jgi:hypothetical protein